MFILKPEGELHILTSPHTTYSIHIKISFPKIFVARNKVIHCYLSCPAVSQS